MRTIQQLKNFARKELGLSDDYVRKFGPLTRKATWQKAIVSYQEEEAIATQESTNFVPPAPKPPTTLVPAEEPEPEEDNDLPNPQTVNLDDLPLVELDLFHVETYDRFEESYKDYSIFFIIPNEGILGVSIVNPEKSKAWSFSTEHLSLYYAEDWHLQVARRYVDKLIAQPPEPCKRLAAKYCSDDHQLPDNLIGAPRLVAKYLSDNFNWESDGDNSYFKLCSAKDYANPEIIEGVKILHTSGHYLRSASGNYLKAGKTKKYSAIVLFRTGETCYFSRLFAWESLSNYNPNANLKLIARQYLRDTIKTFIANVKLIQKVGRSYQN